MLDDIYKAAIRFGMSKYEYFHSTPNDVQLYIDVMAKKEKERREMEIDLLDYRAWLHGLYVARAVASVMSKHARYPKEPLSKESSGYVTATEDMPEEKKEELRQMFLGSLFDMQSKFEANKMISGEG